MLRLSFCSLMLLALSCAPYETVGSRTYYGFSIGVSNAPPPPRVVLVEDPSLVLVPGRSVYVIENSGYDAFRYGGYIYLSSGGYWYRSRGYGHPFRVCDVRSVPRAVLTVPGNTGSTVRPMHAMITAENVGSGIGTTSPRGRRPCRSTARLRRPRSFAGPVPRYRPESRRGDASAAISINR